VTLDEVLAEELEALEADGIAYLISEEVPLSEIEAGDVVILPNGMEVTIIATEVSEDGTYAAHYQLDGLPRLPPGDKGWQRVPAMLRSRKPWVQTIRSGRVFRRVRGRLALRRRRTATRRQLGE
jgi:hypothetical protein